MGKIQASCQGKGHSESPHAPQEGDWVLVRHEKPQKFESKWFSTVRDHPADATRDILAPGSKWTGVASPGS